MGFLDLYELFLADHQTVTQSRQPSSHLQTGLLRGSSHFPQLCLPAKQAARSVRWADVANDGRIVQSPHVCTPLSSLPSTSQAIPASQLHRTLAKLASLETLRVFDVRHYHPLTVNVPQPQYHLDFEGAMYPISAHSDSTPLPRLVTYELYLDPFTRATTFDRLPSHCVRSLRFSGDCHIAPEASFPAPRHLAIRSVTNNAFNTIRFNAVFAASQLESFIYAQSHRLGFKIRNAHLESLVDGPGRCLRKLVLLDCTRLTTPAIAACLRSLPMLEYFALLLVTVNELSENFIPALGHSLRTLKLQVIHAWYAVPLFEEERIICNSLEERILSPKSPLSTIYVSFHSRIMTEDGRAERWKRIAHARHLTLKIGPWGDDEDI